MAEAFIIKTKHIEGDTFVKLKDVLAYLDDVEQGIVHDTAIDAGVRFCLFTYSNRIRANLGRLFK